MSADLMEGYSVTKDGQSHGYKVYRHGEYVAYISQMGALFGNRLAFDWHDKSMWGYVARDFVVG